MIRVRKSAAGQYPDPGDAVVCTSPGRRERSVGFFVKYSMLDYILLRKERGIDDKFVDEGLGLPLKLVCYIETLTRHSERLRNPARVPDF